MVGADVEGRKEHAVPPECRQRIRVPEPKEDVPDDWRQKKTKLPSGAKQHFEKLEGVQDAGEAKIVSGEALREADATGIEYEPRSVQAEGVFRVIDRSQWWAVLRSGSGTCSVREATVSIIS